jgi:hypothetical protein
MSLPQQLQEGSTRSLEAWLEQGMGGLLSPGELDINLQMVHCYLGGHAACTKLESDSATHPDVNMLLMYSNPLDSSSALNLECLF